MSDKSVETLIIAVAVVLVIVIALSLGRRLAVKWGNKSLETGASTGMSMSARGPGSKIERAEQKGDAGQGRMSMRADGGGELKDVSMIDDRKQDG